MFSIFFKVKYWFLNGAIESWSWPLWKSFIWHFLINSIFHWISFKFTANISESVMFSIFLINCNVINWAKKVVCNGAVTLDYHWKSVAEKSVQLAHNIAKHPFAREAGDDDERVAAQRDGQITESDGQQEHQVGICSNLAWTQQHRYERTVAHCRNDTYKIKKDKETSIQPIIKPLELELFHFPQLRVFIPFTHYNSIKHLHKKIPENSFKNYNSSKNSKFKKNDELTDGGQEGAGKCKNFSRKGNNGSLVIDADIIHFSWSSC